MMRVALILTLITIVEVWVYYTPFKDSPLFAPVLLIMSAVKLRSSSPSTCISSTTTSCSGRCSSDR